MAFGRNPESRSREDAGRRNWLEAVPRKMRGSKKGERTESETINVTVEPFRA